jgi:hypothetical protein
MTSAATSLAPPTPSENDTTFGGIPVDVDPGRAERPSPGTQTSQEEEMDQPPTLSRPFGQRRPPASVLEIARFLSRVYSLSMRDEHRAVDEVYRFLDERLSEERFPECNDALDAIEPVKLLPSLIISFLIVTRRAKPHLPARARFLLKSPAGLAKEHTDAEVKRLLQKYA